MAYDYTYPTLTPRLMNDVKFAFKDVNKITIEEERIVEAMERNIEASIGAAELYCNQPLVQKTMSHIFNVSNSVGTYILPFTVPITITSVKSREDGFSAWQDVSTDDRAWATIGRITKLYYQNFDKSYEYQVNGNFGYAENAMQGTLQQIIVDMAKEIYLNTKDDRFGIASKAHTVTGVAATTTYSNMNERFKARLQPFRIKTV